MGARGSTTKLPPLFLLPVLLAPRKKSKEREKCQNNLIIMSGRRNR